MDLGCGGVAGRSPRCLIHLGEGVGCRVQGNRLGPIARISIDTDADGLDRAFRRLFVTASDLNQQRTERKKARDIIAGLF